MFPYKLRRRAQHPVRDHPGSADVAPGADVGTGALYKAPAESGRAIYDRSAEIPRAPEGGRGR